mgnify:CR=1 FL=1
MVLLAIPAPAPVRAEAAPDPALALSARIDAHIEAVWKRDGIKPAERSTDQEFLRRVYFDTVGVPPTRAETLAFLEDTAANRRARLIESLLADPRFGEHLADRWLPILRERGNDLGELGDSAADVMAVWLARQFNANVGFDRTIRAMVTAEGTLSANPAAGYYALMGFPAPVADMAGLTIKHFGGRQVQCAECHDHPYEKDIKQADFAGMASFFYPIETKTDFYVQPIDPGIATRAYAPPALLKQYRDSPDLPPEAFTVIDDLIRYNEPKLFGDKALKTKDTKVWRTIFADWLLSPKNETTGRYLANRFWSFLFGAALLEPVDEFNSINEASHPELLAELGKTFSRTYDVKLLYRALLNSRVYQLSGKPVEGAQRWHHASAAARQLTPEQLLGALLQLTEGDALLKAFARQHQNSYAKVKAFARISEMQNPDAKTEGYRLDKDLLETYLKYFEEMRMPWQLRRAMAAKYQALAQDDEMARSDTFSLSIDQALVVLNGEVTRRLSGSTNGSLVYAVMRDNDTTAKRVDAMYLAILARRPTDAERKRAADYVAEQVSQGQAEQRALEDLFYALVSTTEFATNH